MRNPVFDMMKGLAILLVLVGHLALPNDGFLYKFIYSFHMPLFLILAGYYAKSYEESGLNFGQLIKKDSKRLLLPYILTVIGILLFTAVRALMKHDCTIFYERLFHHAYVSYASIPIWFLVVLFWIRTFFRPIMKIGRWSLPLSILISGSALFFAHHFSQLPLCILTAMAALVFYAIGWYHKKYKFPMWLIIVSIITWPIAIIYSTLDTYYIQYGIYPLSIFGACGGTYVIYILMRYIQEINNKINISVICNVLNWFGKNSLIIVCFHAFDIYCCWVTMSMGVFGIELSYWPIMCIRDAFVILFSWTYVTYLRPYIAKYIS